MTHTDRLWRRWVSAGDPQALGRLFDRTAPNLRQLARHLAHDADAADDALQSTFLAVLERPRELGEDGSVESWLAGILVRQIRRQHHERARERRAPSSETVLEAARAPERSPAGQVAGEEFEVRVAALIERLPPGYAEPLRRQLLGGETASTIAEDLGLSIGNVRARVSRGLKKLRRLMPTTLAGPALGRGAADSSPHSLQRLRSQLIESAGRSAGAQRSGALGVGAKGALTAPLLGLVAASCVAVVGILWPLRGSPSGPELHTEPNPEFASPRSSGPGPDEVQADGGFPGAQRGAAETVEMPPQREGRSPALDPLTVANEIDPALDPGFDLNALTVPNALVIDENTDLPLASAICRVTDSNEVSIIAETDADGRFLTDEVLLEGRVRVSVMGAAQRRELRVLERPGRPKSFSFERPSVTQVSLHVKRGLRHRGDPTVPDRWRIGENRWVPLECTGMDPSGASVEVVLAATFPSPTFETRWPQPPEQEGIPESVVRVAPGAAALVFEAMQAQELPRRNPVVLPPWSRQRVDTTEAGRVVRAVQFLTEGVLVAEAQASVVPHAYETPLRLEFTPLKETSRDEILFLYGEQLGPRIVRHLFPMDPTLDQPRSVRGIITSESGQFHGPVSIMATTSMLELWRGGVSWRQEDSGDWVGTFEFHSLSEGPHHFTASAGPRLLVQPSMAEATPPHVFERGVFVVQDLHLYQPLVPPVKGGAPERFSTEDR